MSQTDLKNSETMHFQTYVDINYFYYLHMKNSFLKLCIFETPCITCNYLKTNCSGKCLYMRKSKWQFWIFHNKLVGCDGLRMWLGWVRQGLPTDRWWGNFGNIHSEDRDLDGRITRGKFLRIGGGWIWFSPMADFSISSTEPSGSHNIMLVG
jgi:hypothetical protein